jgi:hypothetical protein
VFEGRFGRMNRGTAEKAVQIVDKVSEPAEMETGSRTLWKVGFAYRLVYFSEFTLFPDNPLARRRRKGRSFAPAMGGRSWESREASRLGRSVGLGEPVGAAGFAGPGGGLPPEKGGI